MRQLSILELELVIGGYDGGGGQVPIGGYDDVAGDYGYGNSTMSVTADGEASGNITGADVDAVTAGIRVTIPSFDLPVNIGGFKFKIATPPIRISGKK